MNRKARRALKYGHHMEKPLRSRRQRKNRKRRTGGQMSIGRALDKIIDTAIIRTAETAAWLLNKLSPFDEAAAQRYLTMGAADALAEMEAEQEQWEPDELWAATLHNDFAIGEYPPLDSAPGLQPPVERMADASAASAGPRQNVPPGSGAGHSNQPTSELLEDAALWLNLLFINSTASGDDYMKHICPLINQLRRRADDLRIFTN